MALAKHLPIETFKPDVRLLHFMTDDLTPEQREHKRIVLALAGVNYEDVYRAAGLDGQRGVWQMETYALPWRLRETLARQGFEMLSDEKHYDAGGHVFWFVRFCYPYGADTDWPPAPYYARPADWPRVWPWERAPKQPRTDAVAGPAGVVLCDLDTTPAALIPVPGVPGLDYSYADMGMADPAPAVEPEPPAPQPAPKQARKFVSFGEGKPNGMHVYGPMPIELVKALGFVADVEIARDICEQYSGPAYFVKWADGENWVQVGSRLHAALYPYTGMAAYEEGEAA